MMIAAYARVSTADQNLDRQRDLQTVDDLLPLVQRGGCPVKSGGQSKGLAAFKATGAADFFTLDCFPDSVPDGVIFQG